jgi:hypothetical protein
VGLYVTSDKRSLTYPSRAPESCGVHDQIRYATDVKEHSLSHIGKPQQDVLANAAARYNAWALHVQMGFGEPSDRAAVSAFSFGGRNIDSEYLAQLPGSRVAVEIVHLCTHFRPPVGPKRSVLILSGPLPPALRKPATLSTNGVLPQT